MLGLIALTYETIPAQLTNRVGSCEKIDWAVPLSVSKLMARSSEIFIQKKKMTAAGSKAIPAEWNLAGRGEVATRIYLADVVRLIDKRRQGHDGQK